MVCSTAMGGRARKRRQFLGVYTGVVCFRTNGGTAAESSPAAAGAESSDIAAADSSRAAANGRRSQMVW